MVVSLTNTSVESSREKIQLFGVSGLGLSIPEVLGSQRRGS